jgi:radical SAM superfamily enzyme YgiQ (UPF0313 family)
LGNWLRQSGWDTVYINSLDPDEPRSLKKWGRVRRKHDGTGKIFRQPKTWPSHLESAVRRYSRYGICQDALKEKIASCDPQIILITTGMTYWYEGIKEIIELCRKIHGNTPIIAGGIYASLMEEHCKTVCQPDHVVKGEGTGLIPLLTKYNLPAPTLPLSETVITNDPVWKKSGVIRLNKGCPMKCEYCASRLLAPQFQPGTPGETFNQVKKLHLEWGTQNFAFYDDALLVNKEISFIPFLEQIISWNRNLKFYLPNALHARFLDKNLLNLMHKAGFQEIRMGYESSSDEFHKKRDGKLTKEIFESTIDQIKQSDFPLENCAAYVLAGLPGQKWQEVDESVRKGSSYGIRCRIAQYSPVPGSTLWKESCQLSRLPLANEPLYHNSSFMAMEWEGFTKKDLERVKVLSKELSP